MIGLPSAPSIGHSADPFPHEAARVFVFGSRTVRAWELTNDPALHVGRSCRLTF
jgi:hypothetical protein